ncbi:MAG: type I 3-dehydroquinate dehydratase [Chromatiales bacterium]|jgi:3-dehydroquinate dehydratase / shikimate dehydrogenase|nr:type I 3-dehydroquinate dehydratase [Chromatiales bacterium]
MSEQFPLSGVIGIVADSCAQVQLAAQEKLSCVEVRADLLLSNGVSLDQLFATVRAACAQDLGCLFTLRHPTHGGTFDGSEAERVQLNQRALEAGADVVDAEWGTGAARLLLAAGAPVVLSHHDFAAMPSTRELAELTGAMMATGPLAVKVVPTASRLSDSAVMLNWVAARDEGEPYRIGFAMGASGAASRILTIAYGAPITYAAFGASVAPGQVALQELRDIYRADQLDRNTRVFGIAGSHSLSSFSPFLHGPGFAERGINAVYVPLQTDDFDDLYTHMDALRIDGMSVTTPFKEDALRLADEADQRSQNCGASNTLVIERSGSSRRVRAYNTDFDGVLVPISNHVELAGLRVAVIGNGGAARGAVEALKDGGAKPHLFYRNAERGEPVAKALGIAGSSLDSLDDGFDVYLNATTLGTNPSDPSPIPKKVFTRPGQVAFEMLYQNPNSQFLADAGAAGVPCIRGGEMLVAQGVEQFKLFSGETATLAEFERNFEMGGKYR